MDVVVPIILCLLTDGGLKLQADHKSARQISLMPAQNSSGDNFGGGLWWGNFRVDTVSYIHDILLGYRHLIYHIYFLNLI